MIEKVDLRQDNWIMASIDNKVPNIYDKVKINVLDSYGIYTEHTCFDILNMDGPE